MQPINWVSMVISVFFVVFFTLTIRDNQKENQSMKSTRLALKGKINISNSNPIKGT